MICLQVFDDIHLLKYKQAVLNALNAFLNSENQSPTQIIGLKIINDIIKTFTILLTHQINKSIVESSPWEYIKECLQLIVLILNTYFINQKTDNHVKQVRINLNSTFSYAKAALGDHADEFQNFIKLVESNDDWSYEFPEDFKICYSEDLEKQLEHF